MVSIDLQILSIIIYRILLNSHQTYIIFTDGQIYCIYKYCADLLYCIESRIIGKLYVGSK